MWSGVKVMRAWVHVHAREQAIVLAHKRTVISAQYMAWCRAQHRYMRAYPPPPSPQPLPTPTLLIFAYREGAKVLLGGPMGPQLRTLLSDAGPNMRLLDAEGQKEDAHIILEYAVGDSWGGSTSSRNNRFILNRGQVGRWFQCIVEGLD